jgi:hypothetical protein
MAERRPAGFNVDLGFYDSAEVLSIPRKIRAAAIGVWTLCGAYSANKLTDGYVPAEVLKTLGCTTAIRDALIASTLWEAADVGAIQFTRWAKWQRTCAEVKAYKEADAERKRVARAARKTGPTSNNGKMSDRTTTGPSQNVRPDVGTPKTKTKTEIPTHLERQPNVSNAPARSRTYTEMAGGNDRPPPPDPGPERQAGRQMVKTIIPTEFPHDERGRLINEATRLLIDGSTPDVIEDALRLWLDKPHLSAAALPALVSEVLKARHAQPRSRSPSTSAQGILDAGARLLKNYPDQPEIEAENG